MVVSFREVKKFLNEAQIRTNTLDSELWWLHNYSHHCACRFPHLMQVECGTLNGGTVIARAAGIAQAKRQRGPVITATVVTIDSYHDYYRGANPDLVSADTVKERVEMAGLDGIVEVVESDDTEYISTLPDHSVSMMYHDADHRYTPVKKALKAGLPKMVKGGLFSGHDYCFCGSGNVEAVEEFRKEYADNLSGFAVHDKIWWTLVKKEIS